MKLDQLQELWVAHEPNNKDMVMHSAESILRDDQALRNKERQANFRWGLVIVGLLPLLIAAAATGVAPMVQLGYALMAVGVAPAVAAICSFKRWSRQALPGPIDTRSQLQKAASLLARQARLARTSSLWSAPVFVGAALIGLWTYQERGHMAGFGLWALTAALWVTLTLGGFRKARKAEEMKSRMDELVHELDAD